MGARKPVERTESTQCQSVNADGLQCTERIEGHRKAFGTLKHNNEGVHWTDGGTERILRERQKSDSNQL
jgi:hypothetical protein